MSTAQIVAAKTRQVVNIDPRFNEQERSREPWTDAAEFKKAVKSALRRPSQLVYGSETVAAAVERFSAGVRNAEENRPPGDMAIVSHGTVIAGFVAARAGVDAVEVWESLGMPGLVVINWPEAVGVEQVRNFKE